MAALRAHAEHLGLEVPDEWEFAADGHSGATLVWPALRRLCDVVAGGGVDVALAIFRTGWLLCRKECGTRWGAFGLAGCRPGAASCGHRRYATLRRWWRR